MKSKESGQMFIMYRLTENSHILQPFGKLILPSFSKHLTEATEEGIF